MTNLLMRLKVLWDKRDLVKLLVSKNVKLKYRRSFLGYVWSVLNPLLIMIVMTIVFSSVFKQNIDNFPVYLFTGQILFNFMSISASNAIASITANAALLKKTYVPKYIFTFAQITGSLVDLLFSMGALILVMIFTDAKFSWYNLLFMFPVLQLYVFCVGLGMLLSSLNVFFRDIQYIWSAFVTAWLYVTPIFYSIDMLNEKLAWIIKHLNPMYFYIGQFRDLVYYNRMPGLGIIIEGCITAVVVLAIGISVFWKQQDKFILYI